MTGHCCSLKGLLTGNIRAMCRMTEVNKMYKSTVFIFITQNLPVQNLHKLDLTALILPEANKNKLLHFIE